MQAKVRSAGIRMNPGRLAGGPEAYRAVRVCTSISLPNTILDKDSGCLNGCIWTPDTLGVDIVLFTSQGYNWCVSQDRRGSSCREIAATMSGMPPFRRTTESTGLQKPVKTHAWEWGCWSIVSHGFIIGGTYDWFPGRKTASELASG